MAGGLKTAVVTVRDAADNSVAVTHGTGAGSVEAVVAALREALPIKLRFDDLELYSLATGEDSSGEAIVRASHDGMAYGGTAADQDIVFAVAKAYVAAANAAIRNHPYKTEGAEPQWTLP